MAPGLRALPELRDLIIEELGRPAGPEAEAMALLLAARAGVAAVLFYGARLREGAGDRSNVSSWHSADVPCCTDLRLVLAPKPTPAPRR